MHTRELSVHIVNITLQASTNIYGIKEFYDLIIILADVFIAAHWFSRNILHNNSFFSFHRKKLINYFLTRAIDIVYLKNCIFSRLFLQKFAISFLLL